MPRGSRSGCGLEIVARRYPSHLEGGTENFPAEKDKAIKEQDLARGSDAFIEERPSLPL